MVAEQAPGRFPGRKPQKLHGGQRTCLSTGPRTGLEKWEQLVFAWRTWSQVASGRGALPGVGEQLKNSPPPPLSTKRKEAGRKPSQKGIPDF